MNTNKTTTNNSKLSNTGIIAELRAFGIENLPAGLKRETLLELYCAAVREDIIAGVADILVISDDMEDAAARLNSLHTFLDGNTMR